MWTAEQIAAIAECARKVMRGMPMELVPEEYRRAVEALVL